MSEQAELQTAHQHHIWSPEDKPISVHLNPAVLQAIGSPAEPGGGRGVETGGLLLGFTREAGDRWMISVESVQELVVDHTRGESWTVGPQDRRTLESALRACARKRTPDKPAVVGWYRTHTRQGLYLDDADYRLFVDYFPPPANVAMLVSGSTGAFFFWENGEIHRARPYQTFDVPVTPAERPETSAWQRSTRWRLWLALPVLAGLALGYVWNPEPFRRVNRAGIPQVAPNTSPAPRAVFTPPPLPNLETSEGFPSAPESSLSGTPSAQVPTSTSARSARLRSAPAKTVKRLELPALKQRITEPVLESESHPPVPAVRQDPPEIPRRPSPLVHASMEQSKPSAVRRVIGSIPGLGFLKRAKPGGGNERFTPATVLHQVQPISPRPLVEEVPVRVRIVLNAEGGIEKAELLTRSVEPAIARAAMEAAKQWHFGPARMDEKPVASELVVYFRFPAAAAPAGGS